MIAVAQRIPTAAIIYVRVPVEECVLRIVKRGREEEREMNIAFLTILDMLHDIFYLHALSTAGERIPVKIVTGSESDLVEMEKLVRQL